MVSIDDSYTKQYAANEEYSRLEVCSPLGSRVDIDRRNLEYESLIMNINTFADSWSGVGDSTLVTQYWTFVRLKLYRPCQDIWQIIVTSERFVERFVLWSISAIRISIVSIAIGVTIISIGVAVITVPIAIVTVWIAIITVIIIIIITVFVAIVTVSIIFVRRWWQRPMWLHILFVIRPHFHPIHIGTIAIAIACNVEC